MNRGLRILAVVLAGALVPGGCSAQDAPDPEVSVSPVARTWTESVLPAPAGAVGRIVLRDATVCQGRRFVVGAVQDDSGGTVPAAWSSSGAGAWTSIRIDARSYYGKQNVLYSVACREGRMGALGAKAGGAHGYPRTSSWRETPDGVLHEVSAPFELFGGPQAVNVARLDAGPPGWLISGNRMSGAASWVSRDGSAFRIVERAPVLASGDAGETWSFDGVAAVAGWVMVGGELPSGRIDRDAVGWQSPDGVSWRRLPAAGATPVYEELQRVVSDGSPVAVGVRGAVFGVWRLDGDRWLPGAAFGAVPPGGKAGVRSLAVAGAELFCVTSDGVAHTLWTSADGGGAWRPVVLPVAVPAGADRAVAVAGEAGGAGRLLMVVDDGVRARVYLEGAGG
ncbi:hypothetical protein [Actinoplanes sp. NPDC049118]|uniref:hypothetical protein n=1 Tax=Actinoplanes sp. NPDC049118 TaxID=3155769 RepID=UPI0033D3D34B